MKKFLLSITLFLGLVGCSKVEYYNELLVTEVVRCVGDDTFICTVVVKNSSGHEYKTNIRDYYDMPYEGSIVYRHCWEDDEGDRCYTNLYLSKPRGAERR